jgi:hypothetical protein
MGDLLEQGAGWLAGMRTQYLSRTVTYQSGQQQVQLQATVGSTTFDIASDYGVVERWESRDYLVGASDLVLGSAVAQPQRGDTITDAGQVYEVMAPGKEDVFRFSDHYGLTLRIHTKRIGSA